MMLRAGLSLALPPGFSDSSLAKRWNRTSPRTRDNLTSGVWPMADRMLSFITVFHLNLSAWPLRPLCLRGKRKTAETQKPHRLRRVEVTDRLRSDGPMLVELLYRKGLQSP